MFFSKKNSSSTNRIGISLGTGNIYVGVYDVSKEDSIDLIGFAHKAYYTSNPSELKDIDTTANEVSQLLNKALSHTTDKNIHDVVISIPSSKVVSKTTTIRIKRDNYEKKITAKEVQEITDKIVQNAQIEAAKKFETNTSIELLNSNVNFVKIDGYLTKDLEDKEVKDLIKDIFSDSDLKEKFKTAPAAELVHHDYVGGVLEHVYDMLRFSVPYKEIYPQIRYSELVFGIIFHDIGKIYELSQSGVALSRTMSGYLIGHISQGYGLIEKKIPKEFNEFKKDRLLHMILSHHGQLEYGSPIKPMTLEALALSIIDIASSQLEIAVKHIEQNEVDERGKTAFNRHLETSFFP